MNTQMNNTDCYEPNISEVKEEMPAEIIDMNKILVKNFCKWMKRNNLSEQTIHSYSRTIEFYQKKYKTMSKNSLLSYRQYLIDNYSPTTVNQRIQAVNKYLEYSHKKSLALKSVRVQNKPFLENVISYDDYLYFTKRLKKDGHLKTYFIVRTIACTGARPSEVIKFRVDHVENAYMDVHSKGGKIRRIYIPARLQKELLEWLENEGITTGTIFKNEKGETITTRGIAKLIKTHGENYKSIPIECIYPYSFRHMYAKKFLKKEYNLVLLADLLGHTSLETTRIYTRMTSAEQYYIINKIVKW